MHPKGFVLAPDVGELRQDGATRRRNVNFVGSAHLLPKQEKARCWLSQQAFSAFWYVIAQSWSNGGLKASTKNTEIENIRNLVACGFLPCGFLPVGRPERDRIRQVCQN